MTRTIIVGSAGQDGRLLFGRLFREKQPVAGIERNGVRVVENESMRPVNILDRAQVDAAVQAFKPTRIYYLAAVHRSSEQHAGDPHRHFERSFAVQVTGLLHFLDAMRRHAADARLFYAASSHVFGRPAGKMQDESTPMNPVCVYGITKAAGAQLCRHYRDEHDVHASVGILYNHESPLRQPQFVSQKIVRAARAIRDGSDAKLILGDLDARIDWGYAPDYVDAMVRVLEQDEPDDYVVATGEAHSVREFADIAFDEAGLDWREHVRQDSLLLTKERRELVGDASRLRQRTGWQPSISFETMVRQLVNSQEQV